MSPSTQALGLVLISASTVLMQNLREISNLLFFPVWISGLVLIIISSSVRNAEKLFFKSSAMNGTHTESSLGSCLVSLLSFIMIHTWVNS
ncbi:hypothetical protein K435DRAFT_480540 [Dendrothele bispora CBS 962.96]|uniref:Uncharacterized protein n=1 Tax=Dendrothele bispora (strain CBS 962.96) TaxID=1314807 RepID=A0A4S8MVN7_DENBC|nr:hypothetical protein K435DRAFT_480540 [Dendrothele bispora CBS 962.96]